LPPRPAVKRLAGAAHINRIIADPARNRKPPVPGGTAAKTPI